MIAAGDLDTEIEVFEPTLVRDAINGQTEGPPTKVCDEWAEVVALEGVERWRAQQVYATVSHRLRMRRRRDIRVSQRVTFVDYDGIEHTLEVLAVIPVAHDELRLLCAEDMETQRVES